MFPTMDTPELATANFYLFLQMKSALRGRHLCDSTDIIKNEKEELKKAFTKCLPGVFPAPLQSLVEAYIGTRELFS